MWFKKIFCKKYVNIDKTFIKRSRSLSSKHIILYLLHLVSYSSNTDTLANGHLKIENIIKTITNKINLLNSKSNKSIN